MNKRLKKKYRWELRYVKYFNIGSKASKNIKKIKLDGRELYNIKFDDVDLVFYSKDNICNFKDLNTEGAKYPRVMNECFKSFNDYQNSTFVISGFNQKKTIRFKIHRKNEQ